MPRWIAVSALSVAFAGLAFAGVITVPEIDASAGAGAVALLVGGVLVLRARRNKRESD